MANIFVFSDVCTVNEKWNNEFLQYVIFFSNYSIVFDFIEIIFVLTRKKRREIWKTDHGLR
jgi:hypothetical protein